MIRNNLILYTYVDKLTVKILDNLKVCVLKFKRPVSMKHPVLSYPRKSLLNIPNNLKN